MDNIFIDTVIFEENNILTGNRIDQILKLSEEGYIRIILPAVTYNEIRARAIAHIHEAVYKFRASRAASKILLNVNSVVNRFEEIDEKKCVAEFIETFEKRLKKSKCVHIDYPVVSIKEVFDKYFASDFPFGSGKKKDEFPDAFALLSVEDWCKQNGEKCYVFSKDKDILWYKSDHLIMVKMYEEYLDKKLLEIDKLKERKDKLEKAKTLFEKNKAKFQKEIHDWLVDHLYDESIYWEHINHMEIHDIDVRYCEVEIEENQFTKVTDSIIYLEAHAYIDYEVSLEIDDENQGYFDSEDKEWYYRDITTKRIDDSKSIVIQLEVDIPKAGDEYMGIELVSINNGNDLKLPSNY